MNSQTHDITGASSSAVAQEGVRTESLPIIDISALVAENSSEESLRITAQAIGDACKTWGFFYVINHGVCEKLQGQLESEIQQFFALPQEKKLEMALSYENNVYNGYFPLNTEQTSGKPDLKEGLYFGNELPADAPQMKLPMHSPNQWPNSLPEFKPVVLEYMAAMRKLGYAIVKGIALSLELPADYFEKTYLQDPTCIFTTFNYPPDIQASNQSEPRWGIGEHTDYGLLTILKQDNTGGLQIKPRNKEWTEAKPIPNSFVCNLGDMTQIVTKGLYLSTPHRVRNTYTGRDRLSYPFFFEPDWEAVIKAAPLSHLGEIIVNAEDLNKQWDKASPQFMGEKYGDYLQAKLKARFSSDSKTY